MPPRLESLETEDFRIVRRKRVFFADDGRAFIVRSRRRVYGEIVECEGCRVRFFRGDNKGPFCTIACSKRGNRNPSRRKTAKRPAYTCDIIFSRLVRRPGYCEICGSTEVVQCAHGFSRRYRAIRWDFRNAFCLCRKCHMHYTHRPIEWDNWLMDRWGEDLYNELRTLALRGGKTDFPKLLASLRAEWDASPDDWKLNVARDNPAARRASRLATAARVCRGCSVPLEGHGNRLDCDTCRLARFTQHNNKRPAA